MNTTFERRPLGLTIASLLIATAAAQAQEATQWRSEDGGNGHWYQTVAVEISWNDARSAALAAGGDLASLEEEAELLAIIDLILDPNQADLFAPQGWGPHVGGMENASGQFVWLTGPAIDCSNHTCENGYDWQTRVQLHTYAEDAIGYGYNDVGMNQTPDASQPGYLIEWSADCNNDGLVDYGQILDGSLTDANGNGVPDCCETGTPCGCAADLNHDGHVNGGDLSILLGWWGIEGSINGLPDLTGDGLVDAQDLTLVLSSWGACPE